MYELCQHLLASGRRCTQPAVGGVAYCRHHSVVKRTVASSILPPKFHHLHRALPFLYPEDRASIQANCFLVMRALDDRRITTQTANAMNRLLRTCQANLKRGPLHESDTSPADVILSEVDADRRQRVEGPAPSQPSENAGAPCLVETWDKSEKQNDPSIVRRVILTPAGEELAPPFEVWEDGEKPHHGESCPCRRCAAQPGPHHPNCRCGQCPTKPAGAPSFRPVLSGERVGESEQPSPTDVILSGVREADAVEESAVAGSVSGQGFSPASPCHENCGALAPEGNPDDATSEDDDEPFTFYEGDPVSPDPYAAEETEEERKQDLEHREQILDKHKDRLDKVEKQYLYTPQLADRIRDEIQQIMELEMGPEVFSYQLHPPPAS